MVVRGRVQGVGFRVFVASRARSRGVAGWVRNCSDGTVEAVFEGDADTVDALVRACAEGPRGAHVESCDVVDEATVGSRGFEVR